MKSRNCASEPSTSSPEGTGRGTSLRLRGLGMGRLRFDAIDSRPDNYLCQLAIFQRDLPRELAALVIVLHAWPTPDARKICVMLEETGLAYEIVQREAPPAIED